MGSYKVLVFPPPLMGNSLNDEFLQQHHRGHPKTLNMAVLFDEGSWVWIPDETENSLPAKVLATFKPGQDGKVRTEGGEEHWLTADITKVLKPANPEIWTPKSMI